MKPFCHAFGRPSLHSTTPTRIRMPLIHFWDDGGNYVLAKIKPPAGGDLADSTFLIGLDFFAIGDVVSVFFDLVGLLMPKFFVPFVEVLTSGRIFQNHFASSRVTRAR